MKLKLMALAALLALPSLANAQAVISGGEFLRRAEPMLKKSMVSLAFAKEIRDPERHLPGKLSRVNVDGRQVPPRRLLTHHLRRLVHEPAAAGHDIPPAVVPGGLLSPQLGEYQPPGRLPGRAGQ